MNAEAVKKQEVILLKKDTFKTSIGPAKLIIGPYDVQTENANKAHGTLQLEPETFAPYPKNPVIARVFKEIGRADELGSGVRNIYSYYNFYSRHKPLLQEKRMYLNAQYLLMMRCLMV
ncbi:MAG: hypothetical protein PF517_12360 [Salinivirgaceae bacterium]|nr:hypothetical protein [Salinivirgaceae bacterium]